MSVRLASPARLVEVKEAALVAVIRAIRCRCGDTTLDVRLEGVSHLGFGSRLEGVLTLAAASVKLTRLERWIVRRAYRFAPATRARTRLTGERLLGELVADALDDLERNDVPTFRDRLDRLAALHGFLLRLASVQEAARDKRSLAIELAGNPFQSLAGVWASALVPLFERAAARLPESLTAFPHVASLPPRIASEAGLNVTPAALQETDGKLAFLAYRLFDRGAHEAGVVTAGGGVASQPMSLPAAAADWYDEAWRDFAASYNDVLGQRLRSLEAQAVTSNPATVWGLLVSGAPTLRQHLEQTARFVVRAAVIGDTHGGGRVLDLLFGAPEAISLCLTTGSGVRLVDYPDGDMVVSPALMWETDWTKVADVTKPLLPDLGRPVAAKRVFEGVLLNEWRDICLALAVVLGEFALQAGPKSVAAALLGKLLRGEFSDRHSRPAADNPEFRLLLPSPATVLRTAAVVLANDAKRGKLIEEHIRTMREIARPLPVIGQVYVEVASASNELQERSVDVALVLLALALERTLSSLWPTEPSEIGLKAPSEADERIAGFLDAVAKAASEVEDALLHPLAPTHLDPPAIREARQRVRDTCRCLARRLRRRHEQTERTAALDPERLEAIATLAGSLAFDKKKAGPPVSLFARIDLDDAEHEASREAHPCEYKTVYRRGQLPKPLLERPVDNEEKWWAETFRDVVAAAVLRRVYDRIPRRLRLAGPEAWRDALIAWRSEIGPDEPLLLWGRDWPLSWSRDRGVGEAIATRLNTRNPPPEILARTPFLDGVRLVSLPALGEPTLLAPASMFRRLIVSAPHGRPVAIDTADHPNDPTTVNLTLRARLTLDLDRPDRALIVAATAVLA